jgi:hypothetical protein
MNSTITSSTAGCVEAMPEIVQLPSDHDRSMLAGLCHSIQLHPFYTAAVIQVMQRACTHSIQLLSFKQPLQQIWCMQQPSHAVAIGTAANRCCLLLAVLLLLQATTPHPTRRKED